MSLASLPVVWLRAAWCHRPTCRRWPRSVSLWAVPPKFLCSHGYSGGCVVGQPHEAVFRLSVHAARVRGIPLALRPARVGLFPPGGRWPRACLVRTACSRKENYETAEGCGARSPPRVPPGPARRGERWHREVGAGRSLVRLSEPLIAGPTAFNGSVGRQSLLGSRTLPPTLCRCAAPPEDV